MKIKHNIIMRLFINILIFSMMLVHVCPVQATPRDITNSISSKQHEQIFKLINDNFSAPLGIYMIDKMEDGKNVTFDFSEESKRRYVIKYNYLYSGSYGHDESVGTNTVSKRAFGRSTPRCKRIIGEMGMNYPVLDWSPLRIYKYSSSKYGVNAYVHDYDEETGNAEPIGMIQFTIKKKAKTYYGYIVKSALMTTW